MKDVSTLRAFLAYEISLGAIPEPTPIFTPGDHWLESGEKFRQGTWTFATEVFEQVIYMQRRLAGKGDPDVPIPGVFLMAGQPVTFSVEGDVVPFDQWSARMLLGRHVKLIESPKPRAVGGEVEYRDVPASLDHAGLVVTYAAMRAMPLDAIVHHLAYTRFGERMDRGWYQHLKTVVTRPAVHEAFAEKEMPLWDLVGDFCLDEASKAHLLGLMLTILFRPMLDGNVPLFIVNAAMERSGKTKLIQDVVGPILLGSPIATWTMPNDADELAKQITSKLIAGRPVLLADNRATKLDSPELASMITSRTISGRILGRLVAKDYSGAMVWADIIPESDSKTNPRKVDYQKIAHQLEAIRAKYENSKHPNIRIEIIGFAKMVGDIADGAASVIKFFAITIAFTWLLLFLYSASYKLASLTVACALVAVVWMLGALKLMGFGIDPMNMLTPFLIFAIAVSHGEQMINRFRGEIFFGGLEEGTVEELRARAKFAVPPLEAARLSFRMLLVPGAVALLAGCIGFGAIWFIPI